MGSVISDTTHDADFLILASRFHTRRVDGINGDPQHPLMELVKPILDWHPDIDCFVKPFSQRDTADEGLKVDIIYSQNYLKHNFNGVYVIHSSFKYIDHMTGGIAYNSVLDKQFHMPQYLIDVREEGAPSTYLKSYNPNFLTLLTV